MLAKKRIQNKVAESRYALPISIAYSIVIWLLMGIAEGSLLLSYPLVLAATYLVVELNNRNSLIRIYSRIVSCSFLVLTMMSRFLLNDYTNAVIAIATVAFYLQLFRSYQDRNAMGTTFYGFVFLGIASVWWVHILYFVPIFWIVMRTNMICFNIRTFFASLLGLSCPYWFIAGYLAFTGNIGGLLHHFTTLADYGPLLDYSMITKSQLACFVFVAILMMTGIIHFIRKSSYDSIRVRLTFEALIFVCIVTVAFILLQPQHFDRLFSMLILGTAPLISHYIALTKTRVTNISFIVMAIGTISITLLNIWIG